MKKYALLPALSLIGALPALAHPGPHHDDGGSLLRHILAEPDHALAVMGVVVLAAYGLWKWRRKS